jgi:hypothetical protein
MAKDHGSSVKNDKQYEGLRKKGMSKQRAASIANSPNASKKGGEKSGKGQGGSRSQKRAAGREGGRSPPRSPEQVSFWLSSRSRSPHGRRPPAWTRGTPAASGRC